MATLSQDTYIASGAPLTGLGGGGSTASSTFSSIYVADSTVTQALISGYISTSILDADEAYISTLSTTKLWLDDNVLTTASGPGAELLLNGIPIATTENLSSLTEWSYDPAISTLNMNNNPIIGASGYEGTGLVQTEQLYGGQTELSTLACGTAKISSFFCSSINTNDIESRTGYISSLECNEVMAITFSAISTVYATSTISTFSVRANDINVAQGIYGTDYTVFGTELTVEGGDVLNIYGSSIGVFCSTLTMESAVNSVIRSDGGLVVDGSTVTMMAPNGIIIDAYDSVIRLSSLTYVSSIGLSEIVLFGGDDPIPPIGGGEAAITVRPPMSVSSLVDVSTINGEVYPPPIPTPQLVSSFLTASISSASISSINGLAYPPPADNVADWAKFTANSTIRNDGTSNLNILTDTGASVGSAYMTLLAQNGTGGRVDILAKSGFGDINGGRINLTADGGGTVFPVAGSFGQIDITANGGQPSPTTALGGLINITANTPLGLTTTLPSAIKLSAAGVNSYAGAIPAVGSLAGYNFIYGTGGVNICAGLPAAFPNFPGTVYIYGTNGIELGANVYTTNIQPYFSGLVNPSDLVITGRTDNFGFGPYTAIVNVSTVGQVSFSADRGPASVTGIKSLQGTSLEITNLSSINGIPYVPAASNPDILASTITIDPTGFVSTPILNAFSTNTRYQRTSQINVIGTEISEAGIVMKYSASAPSTSVGIWFENNVSSSQVLRVQNVGYQSDVLAVQNYNATFGNAASTLGTIGVSRVLLETLGGIGLISAQDSGSTIVLHNAMLTSTATVTELDGISTINGAVYPPPAGSVPADLAVSTLTVDAAGFVSTNFITLKDSTFIYGDSGQELVLKGPTGVFIWDENSLAGALDVAAITSVSTINGAVYPPPAGSVPADLAVSTLTVDAAGFVSTNFITLKDSTFIYGDSGQELVLKAPTGVFIWDENSLAGALDVAAITSVSTINGAVYPPPAGSVPANLDVSTLTVEGTGYISTPQVYTSSIQAYEASTSFITTYAAYIGGNSTVIYSDGANILQLGADSNGTVDIIGDLVTGALGNLQTSTLTVSTINGVVPGVPANLEVSTLMVQDGGFVSTSYINMDIAAHISTTKSAQLYLNAAGGVYVTDLVAPGVLDVAAITSVSTINGAVYPPAAGSVPVDLGVSTLTTDTAGYVSTSRLYVSSINDGINIDATTITAPIVFATTDLAIGGGATLTIGGSPGADGNVIGQVSGYPAWVAPTIPVVPRVSWVYKTDTQSPSTINSTLTNILEIGVVPQKYSTILLTGTATVVALSGAGSGATEVQAFISEGGGIITGGQSLTTITGNNDHQNIAVQLLYSAAPPGESTIMYLTFLKNASNADVIVQYANLIATYDIESLPV